jgi:hypothetical protein
MTRRPLLSIEKFHAFKFLTFSDTEIEIVKQVLAQFDPQQAKVVRRQIANLKRSNVPFDNLIERIIKINELGKDSSSLLSFQLRYGDEVGLEMFDAKNSRCKVTRHRLEEKVGLLEADRILKSRGASLANYVQRHGQDIGEQKWFEYCIKRAAAYKRRHEEGYQFARYTKSYFIQLYGEDEGIQRWEKREEKRRYKNSKQRYIDEYGEELGSQICRQIKTTVSKECFRSRYGVEQGEIEYEKFMDKQARSRTYSFQSKSSLNFFSMMVDLLDLNPDDCKFGSGREKIFYLNSEERLLLPQRVVLVDFTKGNKIIEYNGDQVHANPMYYRADDRPHPWDKSITSSDIWHKDAMRNLIITNRGYSVLVIWERETFENPDEILARCKQFLED